MAHHGLLLSSGARLLGGLLHDGLAGFPLGKGICHFSLITQVGEGIFDQREDDVFVRHVVPLDVLGHPLSQAGHGKTDEGDTLFNAFHVAMSDLEVVEERAHQPGTPLVGTVERAFLKQMYHPLHLTVIAIDLKFQYFFNCCHIMI